MKRRSVTMAARAASLLLRGESNVSSGYLTSSHLNNHFINANIPSYKFLPSSLLRPVPLPAS